MRILGLDYGIKRIGLALSDPMHIIASPLQTYFRKDLKSDLEFLKDLCRRNEVGLIVVGVPYNMDGTAGEAAIAAKEFGETVSKALGIPVNFRDERWSTTESHRRLIEADVKRGKRKEIVDKIAAQIILQSYLDNNKNNIL